MRKSCFAKIVEIVVVVVLAIALTGIGLAIYKLVSNIKQETGESAENTKFSVEVQGKTYETSTGGLVFTDSETFSLVYSGADSEISAKIKTKKLSNDYVISAQKTVDGETQSSEYRWNTDFPPEDMTSYFDVAVDQSANTVTVNGTMKDAVTRYLKRRGWETIVFPNVPASDMFVLELQSGDAMMALGFHVYASVYSIDVPNLNFC